MAEIPDTKQRILDAAEKLFAEQGFASTSLREITSQAEANLAAVNYHFGSKEDLIRAVFARRLGPLGQARLKQLDAVEAAAGEGPPSIEGIVEAFIGPPVLLLAGQGRAATCFPRIFGRMTIEPTEFLTTLFREHIEDTVRRFHGALMRALPEEDPEEVAWRLMFMVGVLAHTIAAESQMKDLSPFPFDSSDRPALVRRMVRFITGGMQVHTPKERSA